MQHGVVKWFDPVKGYGFIAGDTGADIFVHQSDILMKGFRNLEVGQRVSYQMSVLRREYCLRYFGKTERRLLK